MTPAERNGALQDNRIFVADVCSRGIAVHFSSMHMRLCAAEEVSVAMAQPR